LRDAARQGSRRDQAGLDAAMIALDGTDTKGARRQRAAGVSLANAHAAANEAGATVPLWRHAGDRREARVMPVPMMNIINGGAHADNNVDMQEFMILPVGAPSASPRRCAGRRDLPHAEEDAARPGCRRRSATRAASRRPAVERSCARGDPEAIEKAGYKAGPDIYLGPRRGELGVLQERQVPLEARASFDSAQFADYLADWSRSYPIVTIEDGMAEGDWDGWKLLTERSASACSWSATTCSSPTPKILKRGIDAQGIANSILIKPNQIGTLTETLAAIEMARRRNTRLGRLASLRRNRGHHHRRPRGRHLGDARSRPVRCAARTAWPSTTSCCASRLRPVCREWMPSDELGGRARRGGIGSRMQADVPKQYLGVLGASVPRTHAAAPAEPSPNRRRRWSPCCGR
jgi:hypothetical protein